MTRRWEQNAEAGQRRMQPMRVVLTNIGTMGDVHPLIALALRLQQRGHEPLLAVPEVFRERVRPLGIPFHAVRPDIDPQDTELAAKIYEPRHGTEYGLRRFLFPALRQSYADLLEAVNQPQRADLLVTGELNYAAPLVAEHAGVPWASTVLAPISFFSVDDPPALPMQEWLSAAYGRLPGVGWVVNRLARQISRSWPEPILALRRELGLPPGRNPLFEGKHSPLLVLALFDRLLGERQRDWPAMTVQTGFCYHDADSGMATLPEPVEEFLDAGEPPVVFTLGSAAVMTAGDFFAVAAEACRRMGRRAVLLVGPDSRNRPETQLPESICVAEYAPHSLLFPRSAAVVHQGGVGTVAQCLRAGRPMLIVPWSHDQPDNAFRMVRLGTARSLARKRLTVDRLAGELTTLLDSPRYAAAASAAARQLQVDGCEAACEAMETLVEARRTALQGGLAG